jgi:glycosyltransferase involved in cell wall biosynthesis
VTSKANGLEELAGDAALLVDPHDPDEIARAAYAILTDPALAARLRAAGLERSRLFSWEACARQTLSVLEAAVGERNLKPARGSAASG